MIVSYRVNLPKRVTLCLRLLMNKFKSVITAWWLVMVIIATSSLFGLCVDFLVSKGIYLCKVKKIHDLCFIIIQIQATLATLVIAITALLSGLMSKSYLGISLVSFVLNEKTWVKFKSILLCEFLLLLVSIIGLLYEKYNTVFIIFTVSMVLILNLSLKVCSAFVDTNSVKNEILDLFQRQIQTGKNYKDVGLRFIEDWKKAISNKQSQEDYDKHFDLFISLLKRIITKEKDTETVNSFLEQMARYLLKSEDFSIRVKGVFFVTKFYKKICDFIKHNEIDEGEIRLFSKVYNEWWDVVNSLDVEYIEKNINISGFMKDVLLCISCLIDNSKNSNSETEAAAVYFMAKKLGVLLDKFRNKKQNVNLQFWTECITRDPHMWSRPKECTIQIHNYWQAVNLLNFNICCGYLLYGYWKNVKAALFPKERKNYQLPFNLNEKAAYNVILELMLVHCFIYYLAYHSNSPYKNDAQSLLSDKEVIGRVKDIFNRVCNRPQLITSELKEKVEFVFKDYSIYFCGKYENIGKVYFLYMAIGALEGSKRETKQHIIKFFNVNKYDFYLYGCNYDEIIDVLANLGKNIESNLDKKNIKDRYDIFCSEMKQKYKYELIKTTKDNYQHLIRQKEDIQNAIEERLNKGFNDYFERIKSPIENKNRVRFYFDNNLHDVATLLVQEDDMHYVDSVWKEFIRQLIANIRFRCELINRKEKCDEDSEIRKIIKDRSYNLLIGDVTILHSKYGYDINKYLEHEKFMNSLEKVEIESDNVLAINAQDIKIHLNKIMVDIVPPTKQKIEEYNENMHIFTTKKGSGIVVFHEFGELRIDFKEKDFWDFYNKYMQNITITFDISMEIKETENKILATVFQ